MTDPETLARWRASTIRRILLEGDGHATVFMRRRYDYPAEAVWDAWTNPERLARWLAPVTGDLRPGGDLVIDMAPDGLTSCRIVACQPPRRLAVTWSFGAEPQSAVELRLAPDGDGTLLELEHTRLPSDLGVSYGHGWEDFLNRLGTMLAGGDPTLVSFAESQQEVRPLWETVASA